MHTKYTHASTPKAIVCGFWCFVNGVLGSYQTNNREIKERTIRNIPIPAEYESFLELLPRTQKGTLANAKCSAEGASQLTKVSS